MTVMWTSARPASRLRDADPGDETSEHGRNSNSDARDDPERRDDDPEGHESKKDRGQYGNVSR
jgi:hypothetical protein